MKISFGSLLFASIFGASAFGQVDAGARPAPSAQPVVTS